MTNYVRIIDAMFYGLTKIQLMELAFHFVVVNNIQDRFNCSKKLAGMTWLLDFCKRNGLIIRNPE